MTQWGLDTLFNPAKRHMDEEKRRLQSTREEVGDNSGGKRIDFESGKVVIHRPGDDESDVENPELITQGDTATTKRAQDDAKSADRAGPPTGKSAPSAAAIRAAQRRGRQAR